MTFTVQKLWLIKRQKPNQETAFALRLTTSLLNVYLQHFLLPRTSYPAIRKKKIIRHTKRVQTQFEEKEVSEPDITEILELPDWEFKTAVMDMLRALMGKVDSI